MSQPEPMNNSDRRGAERSRLPLAVRCNLIPSRLDAVLLVELSQTGCQIRTNGTPLATGRRIVIRPELLPALPAVVKWAVNDAAGMEFMEPLHEAILRHLLYEPTDHAAEWNFVDGFGRRLPEPRSGRGW